MKDTKTDQAILKGGIDSPRVSGDFHLFEVSISKYIEFTYQRYTLT